MTLGTRWAVVGLSAVILTALIPAGAKADYFNVGARYLTYGNCCNGEALFGSRARIQRPAEGFSIPSHTAGFARTVAFFGNGLYDAGMLLGFGASSIAFVDCGSASSLSNIWLYARIAEPEHCAWLSAASKGGDDLYSVMRRPDGTNGSNTEWGAWLEGALKLSTPLYFSAASEVRLDGMLTSTTVNPPDGYIHGCYGCGGSPNWQRAQSPGGSWFTVQSAYVNPGHGWTFLNGPPIDFEIIHYDN